MRIFFNGWRRRAGCITLLFALALMGAWLKSLRIHDEWKPWKSDAVVYITASENGRLVFGRIYKPRMLVTGPFTESETNILIINKERMISGVVFKKDWEVNRYLFSLERRSHFWWNPFTPATIELELLVIPYSSIVLPLTLLSAYLILWMPRKRA
jgi:hypothetical protein